MGGEGGFLQNRRYSVRPVAYRGEELTDSALATAKLNGILEKTGNERPRQVWPTCRGVQRVVEIKQVFELPSHIPLGTLLPGATPPQSFRYLNPTIVQELEALT